MHFLFVIIFSALNNIIRYQLIHDFKEFDFREIPLPTITTVASKVKIGHLKIGEEIKQKFNDWVEVSSDERPERRDVKLHMGIYYHCDDIWNPEVGDIRVQFYYAGASGEPVSRNG